MADGTPEGSPVKGAPRPLTTTSYAILGLLSVRPWSAYELTGQMKRGLRHTWPRTETRIYQEPKNLVRHGLALARTEATGNRRRHVYSITAAGRQSLARWLEEASEPPRLESEALLRTTFADSGTNEALRRTLQGLRREADGIRRQLGDQAAGYLSTGGPFPQRLHIIALIGRFLSDYAELLDSWATWAQAEVDTWPATGPAGVAPIATDVFHLVLGRASRTADVPTARAAAAQ